MSELAEFQAQDRNEIRVSGPLAEVFAYRFGDLGWSFNVRHPSGYTYRTDYYRSRPQALKVARRLCGHGSREFWLRYTGIDGARWERVYIDAEVTV